MYPAGPNGQPVLDFPRRVGGDVVAVPPRIPVRFEDVFPHGAFALGVEAAVDFEKVKANAPDVQARDRDSGERVWSVRVLDAASFS